MPETTNKTAKLEKGTLFYDGTCGFCTRGIRRIRKPLATVGVVVAPFENGAEEPEMILHWHDGRIFGGADAAVFLARRFPLLYLPAVIAGAVPFIYITRAGYRHIAKNRHCIGNSACRIDFGEVEKPRPAKGWIITGILVATAIAIGFAFAIPAWIWMWLIAFAMWLGFKMMHWIKAGGMAEVHPGFFLWPGMDTAGFLYDRDLPETDRKIAGPILFITIGILFLLAIPPIPNPIAKGWAGVTTMLCLLHFGSFDLLAAFWHKAGFGPEPIMRKPWLSRSLADFWGTRWNRGFSDWAGAFLFRPLTRKFGITTGTMAGFLASGIAHELVISLPAKAGFGLPTLYFLIQGTVVLLEKKARIRNRFIPWLAVLLPAPLLFHTAFIETVFNPMTELITNLWNH